ncbi:MAG: hypothetical protein ACD_39C00636G0011, partial [uncultured bacterium]
VKHYNEPFADSSAIPSYYVAKMTRQNVTVALSGDGGDESFAGYQHYADLLSWNKFDCLNPNLRKLLARLGAVAVRPFNSNNMFARIERGFAMLACCNIKERRDLSITTLKAAEKRQAYTEQFKNFLKSQKFRNNRIANFACNPKEGDLDWLMRHDQNFYLPDCLMVKTDIASMANSLEVRSPFLDHCFIEFAATIPSSLKRNETNSKIILKQAVAHLLPEEILSKPKTGFAVPLAHWLRHDLADMLRATLLSDKSFNRNLFMPELLKKMVEEHIAGQRDWSNRLYAFLFLELWFQEFID